MQAMAPPMRSQARYLYRAKAVVASGPWWKGSAWNLVMEGADGGVQGLRRPTGHLPEMNPTKLEKRPHLSDKCVKTYMFAQGMTGRCGRFAQGWVLKNT